MPRGEKSGALMVEKSEALSPALVPRTSLPFGMLAAFMDFVARHGVPSLRYSFSLGDGESRGLCVPKEVDAY